MPQIKATVKVKSIRDPLVYCDIQSDDSTPIPVGGLALQLIIQEKPLVPSTPPPIYHDFGFCLIERPQLGSPKSMVTFSSTDHYIPQPGDLLSFKLFLWSGLQDKTWTMDPTSTGTYPSVSTLDDIISSI